jgi:hypothetical protein
MKKTSHTQQFVFFVPIKIGVNHRRLGKPTRRVGGIGGSVKTCLVLKPRIVSMNE